MMNVPDGWKLVPIESTGKMDDAGLDALRGHDEADHKDVERCYLAMLAAAPAAPVAAPVPSEFDDYPEFHQSAMGCGLEDRNITDRYDAMRYGWDEAVERVAERISNHFATLAQPAAQDKLDAERYRWLRDSGDLPRILIGGHWYGAQHRACLDLDAAIDVARGAA